MTAAAAADDYDNDDDTRSTNSTKRIFLTSKNYDEMTSNKTVLIKWAAPWYSHSQALAPVWDRLLLQQDNFSSSSSEILLLAEVDCGHDAQLRWCIDMGYTAYPTLTYGDASYSGIFLQTYQSLDKSYHTLMRFIQDELVDTKFCTPGNLQACPGTTRTKLESFWNLTIESLERLVSDKEAEVQRLHDQFDDTNKELQEVYNSTSTEHHTWKAQVKRRTKTLRDILNQKKKASL